MITSRELTTKIVAMLNILNRNYASTNLDAKKEIDVARYKLTKRIYEEADDAIRSHEVDWDDEDYMEDFDNIDQLMYILSRYIRVMEKDLNI